MRFNGCIDRLPAGTSADPAVGFKTGGHKSGYMLDRIRVPFGAIAAVGPNMAA